MKVIGEKYGIQITRPWNSEMYAHNDMVAELMKGELLLRLKNAYENKDFELVKTIGKTIGGYGYGSGFGIDEIYTDTIKNIENAENYWLNEEFPYAVSKGLVSSVGFDMIGY